MCFEQKVTKVVNGIHENGEKAVITNASGDKVTAEDGFYFGKNDNSLVGPFPSFAAATTHAYALHNAAVPARLERELASAH